AVSAACPLYLIASRKHKGLKYHHGAVKIASSGWICRPITRHHAGLTIRLMIMAWLVQLY
ncbi:MAG: hypothetical protein ACPH3M_09945, partial [Candidatus Puniceispirillales bacterium]